MSLRDRVTEAGSRVRGALPAQPSYASLTAQLAAVPMPASPAGQPWTMSVASLVAGRAAVPAPAAKALHLLDRFGAVEVGPERVGFDGDDAAWASVTGVQLGPAGAVLTESALDAEVDRLKRMLPPLPGRGWVLGQVADVVGLLIGQVLPGDGRWASAPVVTAVECTGRLGRRHTVRPGMAASLLMTACPDVVRSVVATARAHGVPVADAGTASAGGDARRLQDRLRVRMQGGDG